MTRRNAVVGLATALTLLAPLLLDRLFPPDMRRYRDASVEVQDRSGRLLRAYLSGDHAWRLATRPEDVDPRYLRLLLAYEDNRFALHPGVDPLAILRAVGQWVSAGRPVSGGSTITMQAVRLLEPRPRTLASKIVEAMRAAQLEWRYSKREILGIYLTLAPFGGNLEGVRAATLSYFGKEPAHLTDAEAALLVALPQSPTRRRPDRHPAVARAAQLRVIDRLAAADMLSAQAAAEAREDVGRQALLVRRPFPRAAEHLADRLKASAPPGAVLRSSLDGALQAAAESLLRREAAWFRDGAAIAAIVVGNTDAKVRIYVGGQDYFGPAGMLDLARASRSPGSTLKPFIYAVGFDDRIVHPETQILDRPTQFGGYAPANFDGRFHGLVTIREALQGSLNVPAVAVLDRVGPQRLAALLRDAGASLTFPETGTPPSLALALGGVGIPLADMAMLYRGLAAGGIVRPLSLLEGEEPAGPAHVLASSRAAWLVGEILRGTPVPETVAHGATVDRREIAYKTGTSYGYRDAWAVGWSASYTVAVWVGRGDGTPRAGVLGRDAAAPVLFKLFALLPGLGERLSAPAEAEWAARGEPPPGLIGFRSPRAPAASGPRIIFPPDGSEVPAGPVRLRVEGGTAPLHWLVNGVPVSGERREAEWVPDGEGFARAVVVDANGRSARTAFRILAD